MLVVAAPLTGVVGVLSVTGRTWTTPLPPLKSSNFAASHQRSISIVFPPALLPGCPCPTSRFSAMILFPLYDISSFVKFGSFPRELKVNLPVDSSAYPALPAIPLGVFPSPLSSDEKPGSTPCLLLVLTHRFSLADHSPPNVEAPIDLPSAGILPILLPRYVTPACDGGPVEAGGPVLLPCESIEVCGRFFISSNIFSPLAARLSWWAALWSFGLSKLRSQIFEASLMVFDDLIASHSVIPLGAPIPGLTFLVVLS